MKKDSAQIIGIISIILAVIGLFFDSGLIKFQQLEMSSETFVYWKSIILRFVFPLILVAACVFLILKNRNLKSEIVKLRTNESPGKNELTELTQESELYVQGIPVHAFLNYFWREKKKDYINSCALTSISLEIIVLKSGRKKLKRRDMKVRWSIKGINSTDSELKFIYLWIGGDHAAKSDELDINLVDHRVDSELSYSPRLIIDNPNSKLLELNFIKRNVKRGEAFDLELTYNWPLCYNVWKDYWFIDPNNFSGNIGELVFSIKTEDKIIEKASLVRYFLGKEGEKIIDTQFILPITSNKNGNQEMKCNLTPDMQSVYFITTEGV